MTKNSKDIKNVFFFVYSSSNLHKGMPVFFIVILLMLLSVFLFSGCSALGLAGLNVENQKKDVDTADAEETQAAKEEFSAENATAETTAEESAPNTDTSQTEEATAQDSISDEEVTINVYYANSTGEYLVGEARTVSGANRLIDSINEMMKEPVDATLIKLIPETTKINSVKVLDGVAKVDLSEQFVDDRFVSDSVDILLVYSIVNTLTEFEEIHSVEFYIDGAKLDELGQLDIKDPVFRRSDLIKE
ncbi:MAG: GerMN domain-containing protein [Actinobacteria bacterium]|nr:GerMN domain-containing protein [Actinomycetota bacterium]